MTNEMTPQQIVKIVQLLEQSTQTLDSKTLTSLAESRTQAVAALENRQHATEMQPVAAGWGRLLEFSQGGDYRLWILALLLLAALAATFGSRLARDNTPIDTDSLLLSSELPPEAYADKEFVAWLEHTSRL